MKINKINSDKKGEIMMLKKDKNFSEFEKILKQKVLSTYTEKSKGILHSFNTIFQLIVEECHRKSKELSESVYLLSLAIKINPIFKIFFSEEINTMKWTKFSSTKIGIIPYNCQQCIDNKLKVKGYYNKEEVDRMVEQIQKKTFKDSRICAFFVVPIIIQNEVIGSIQLSLTSEIDRNNNICRKIENFLTNLADILSLIIYLEYEKMNTLIEQIKSTLEILANKDEYQYKHSVDVATIASCLSLIINFNKKDLFKKDMDDIDVLKVYIAGLLHDIGKTNMDIFDFFKKTKDEESSKRVLHPYFSYIITNKMNISEDIEDIVAFHQERLEERNERKQNLFLSENAKQFDDIELTIVQLADIIDSKLRPRPGKPKREGIEELEELIKSSNFKSKFKAKIFEIFETILLKIISKDIPYVQSEVIADFYELIKNVKEYCNIKPFKNKTEIYVNIYNYIKTNFEMYHRLIVFSFVCNIKLIKNITNKNGIYNIKIGTKVFEFKLIKQNNGYFIGYFKIGKPKIDKESDEHSDELIVDFFNTLKSKLKNIKFSVAIITYKLILQENFEEVLEKCIKKLKLSIKDITDVDIWHLLRFDANKNEWK